MNPQHAEVMSRLSDKHDVINDLIAGNQVTYLDIPFYGNVGDLLIMSGTLAFFKKKEINVTQKAMYFNFSSAQVNKGNVILFQGGGNFGDIYGPFQRFREKIISECHDNRIVVLPQTIHFSEEKNYIACCEILSKHPDLHICVRDQRSYELAKKMTNNVYLLPDMAHQLWPISTTPDTSGNKLFLKRRDSELAVNSTLHVDENKVKYFDWCDLVGSGWIFFLSQIAERTMYHMNRLGVNGPFLNLEVSLWLRQADRFVEQAIELFSAYSEVESDRLHAHILSCLMSIPNKIHDNSYGKNSNYIAQWTKDSPLVELVK